MEPCVFTRKKINIIIINLSKVNAGWMEKYYNVTLGMNTFYFTPFHPPPSVTFWIPELYTDLCWNFVKVILVVCHNWRPSQQIYLILDSQPWKSSSSRQLYVCLIAGRWTEEMFEKLFLSLMYPPLSITHFLNFKKYIFEFSMTIAFIKLLYVMKTF